MMYPSEENIQVGNKDLFDLFLEGNETDVGVGFVYVMAISPIIVLFIPFLALVVPTIVRLDIYSPKISIASVTLMSWVPAINSLSTMFIIKSYRNAIKNIFPKKVHPSETTATAAATNNQGLSLKVSKLTSNV
uniref:Uncharacterized protein n=1 Tax=Acrobeloides nanus TaxID=290746 RepID=A0A914ELU1_9BILA